MTGRRRAVIHRQPRNPRDFASGPAASSKSRNLQRENAILRKETDAPVPLPGHPQQDARMHELMQLRRRRRQPENTRIDSRGKRHRKELIARRDPQFRHPRRQAVLGGSCRRWRKRCSNRACSATKRAPYRRARPQERQFEQADGGTKSFLEPRSATFRPSSSRPAARLQERSFYRVGGAEKTGDVRVIAAPTSTWSRQSPGAVPENPLSPERGSKGAFRRCANARGHSAAGRPLVERIRVNCARTRRISPRARCGRW